MPYQHLNNRACPSIVCFSMNEITIQSKLLQRTTLYQYIFIVTDLNNESFSVFINILSINYICWYIHNKSFRTKTLIYNMFSESIVINSTLPWRPVVFFSIWRTCIRGRAKDIRIPGALSFYARSARKFCYLSICLSV